MSLEKERYQLVTHRQEYHADCMRASFLFYIKVFILLVTISIFLVSQKSSLMLKPEMTPVFLKTLAFLINFIGIISIMHIILSLVSWKGYRDAESEICPAAPKVPKHWWLYPTLYCVIIIVLSIIPWCFMGCL